MKILGVISIIFLIIKSIIKELIEIAKLLNKLFKECLPLICTLTTLWLLIKYGF